MHLDTRSCYSFHDGVASPAELCAQAAEIGFTELGVADVDGTYGLVQFYKAALKNGVKPILGIALTEREGFRGQDAGGRGSGTPTGDTGSGESHSPRDAVGAEPCLGPQNDGRTQGSAPTDSNGGPPDGRAKHGFAPTDSDIGLRTADTTDRMPVPPTSPAEPAAWVFARDREGYGELCWLASWRQGCVEEGRWNREQGRGEFSGAGRRARHSVATGTKSGPTTTSSLALAHVLATHTDHCFVITDREALLNHLAPRLGPRRLFVRLDPNYGETYRARQLRQLKLAARYGLHPAACSDVRFCRPQDQAVHHVLRAIGQCATLHTATGVRPRQHYLAAPTELPGYYYDCPQALSNARWIASKCEVDFELGRWVFPDYPLKNAGGPPGEAQRQALFALCQRGLAWRGSGSAGGWDGDPSHPPATTGTESGPTKESYAARLAYELKVIDELGYTSYFLAVYDIVREARRRRIPHVGRGSAANSLVSYLLGLTPVDPLRYDMYFERFLNPQRSSPPDIDIDFNWKRRDEIIDYVYQRWGHERVAMISTHVTYRARSALREVAKVFGLGDAEISAVSKFLPHIAASGLGTAQRDFPELRGVDLQSEPYCHVLPLASRLDGKPRHLGIHCGGIVIAPTRITDYSGMQRAAKGFVVTQYDMFPIEDVGLIKIDLLGNRSLGVLEDALASISSGDRRVAGSGGSPTRRHAAGVVDPGPPSGIDSATAGDAGVAPAPDGRTQGAAPTEDGGHGGPPHHEYDIRAIINDWETLATDPATVEMIRQGLTMGCFYIESPGMRQLLRRLRTQTFLDLTAASSVIRPGVAESGMMQEYIRRVRGEAAKQPAHPLMREIMPETHGVMIYQEDVMKVAHRLAGMSLADADLLRRAMSGKLRSQAAMNQLRERFLSGCEQRGIELSSALEVWRQVASFAGYSFCKAHSASFATLSFQVTYLKAHYPAQFMAAVLSNGGGFYGPRAYLSECERLGLRVLPPDVNYSRMEYTAEKTGTREQGTREQGTGNREQGIREQGTGNREQGIREQGTGNREQKEPVGGTLVPPLDHPVAPDPRPGAMPPRREEASRLPGRIHAAPAPDFGLRTSDFAGGPPAPPESGPYSLVPNPSSLVPNPFPYNAVRVGLALIKGAGAALLQRVVRERVRGGPFRNLPDFIRRTRPPASDLEILIKCGALDSLGMTRPEMLWLAQIERKAVVGQASCLPTLSTGKTPVPPNPSPLPFDDSARLADFHARVGATLDDYDELLLCELELEHLGLLVRRHPLSLFDHLAAGLICARDLPRHTGRFVRLLGWCIAVKRVDLTRRQAVRDTLELLAEHADRPEPSASEAADGLYEEREGTAEDLGIVLRQQPGRLARRGEATLRPGANGDKRAMHGIAPTESLRAMKFMSMEDLSGTYEVTLFADAYARFAPLTRYSGPFLVYGKVEEQFDTYTVNATGLQLLRLDEEMPAPPPTGWRDGAVRTAGRAKEKRS